jgi:hypothetical protein
VTTGSFSGYNSRLHASDMWDLSSAGRAADF